MGVEKRGGYYPLQPEPRAGDLSLPNISKKKRKGGGFDEEGRTEHQYAAGLSSYSAGAIVEFHWWHKQPANTQRVI